MGKQLNRHSGGTFSRMLRLESLEDRRVLAPIADIIFLMDESGSGTGVNMIDWVKDRVFAATPNAVNPISQVLAAHGFEDSNVRYGLIGFGGSAASGGVNGGFAHSYVIDAAASDPLFGSAAQMDAALENFTFGGDGEDGWDAFEHLIAEYKFRDGAVPVAILLQNSEGRNSHNKTLLREGVMAALESKSVLVNSLVYGSDQSGTAAEMFSLDPYGGDANVRIFGVESDLADFVPDGQHNYRGINTTTNLPTNNAGSTHSDAMQISYNGSGTGVTGMVVNCFTHTETFQAFG